MVSPSLPLAGALLNLKKATSNSWKKYFPALKNIFSALEKISCSPEITRTIRKNICSHCADAKWDRDRRIYQIVMDKLIVIQIERDQINNLYWEIIVKKVGVILNYVHLRQELSNRQCINQNPHEKRFCVWPCDRTANT